MKKEIAASPDVVLIDLSSYIYRAFHALPPLTNSQGQQTGAVYGVIQMVKRLLADYPSRYVGVVLDAKEPTFRHALYPDYKKHRQAMPTELVSQLSFVREILTAWGLPLICISGVEADDVIATFAKQAEQQRLSVLISTGDKDLAQLVSPQISLINTMNQQYYTPEAVEEKFGVLPNQMTDYLSLVGDASDNIPGVPQCGPKTAVKWLKAFGNLQGVIAHADQISGKVGESLRSVLPELALWEQLVKVNLTVSLPLQVTDLLPTPPQFSQLIELYQQLEFKSLLKELKATPQPASAQPDHHYSLILREAELETWLKAIQTAELVSVDTETTSLSYVKAEIVGISLSVEAHQAAYIPCGHDYLGAPAQLSRETVLSRLKPFLEDPNRPKVGQHIKYDMNVLARAGITLRGVVFDTMLESYVHNSTATRHDLGSLAAAYLGYQTISFEDVAGKGKHQLTFNQVPVEKALEYSGEDADVTLRLHQRLWPQLQTEPRLSQLLTEVEVPLIPVLSKMECAGVLIDTAYLKKLSHDFSEKMQSLEAEIFAQAGQPFNIESPKQLQGILFDKMGLPVLKKTPGGQASTAEATLQELAKSYAFPALIMEYRMYAKLKSTYTDKLPTLVEAQTGRVHTSYHQAITSTGRLSSSDPNLQNIPIRTPQGSAIRQAFIAPEGYQLLSADYSQIELRIMAHLSGDPGFLKAFAAGEDVHRATAADIFGITRDQITAEQRRQAKAINFGLLYGMSSFGLAKQLQLPRQEADRYIQAYFKQYTGVKAYMESIRQQAREKGYVETLLGRRLYLPTIHDRNKVIRDAAERAAINAPMQGTAADLIKIAMIRLDKIFSDKALPIRMIMQVHDELVFEVREDAVESIKPIIQREMCSALSLSVPLTVDMQVGKQWS